jgi:hypothetical protein
MENMMGRRVIALSLPDVARHGYGHRYRWDD